jgi:hypothetical protein
MNNFHRLKEWGEKLGATIDKFIINFEVFWTYNHKNDVKWGALALAWKVVQKSFGVVFLNMVKLHILATEKTILQITQKVSDVKKCIFSLYLNHPNKACIYLRDGW